MGYRTRNTCRAGALGTSPKRHTSRWISFSQAGRNDLRKRRLANRPDLAAQLHDGGDEDYTNRGPNHAFGNYFLCATTLGWGAVGTARVDLGANITAVHSLRDQPLSDVPWRFPIASKTRAGWLC